MAVVFYLLRDSLPSSRACGLAGLEKQDAGESSAEGWGDACLFVSMRGEEELRVDVDPVLIHKSSILIGACVR